MIKSIDTIPDIEFENLNHRLKLKFKLFRLLVLRNLS